MSNSFRPNRDSSSHPTRSEMFNTVHGPRAEYIRIARALLGVTPAQLASQIGVPPPPPASVAFRPTQTLDRLSGALHAVIGWYHNSLDDEGAANSNDRSSKAAGSPGAINAGSSIGGRPSNGLALDTLVHEYLELRSSWENREAIKIASRIGDKSTHQEDSKRQADQKSPPLQPEVAAGGMGRRTALLVDDASDVVVTVAAFLEAFGFDVIRTSSADHALEILASGTHVDLLITDHAMPGMTGKDLATQACQNHPALRALIITGYPDADELATLPEHVMLLAKPFRRIELREQIRLLFAAKPVADMQAEMPKVQVSQA